MSHGIPDRGLWIIKEKPTEQPPFRYGNCFLLTNYTLWLDWNHHQHDHAMGLIGIDWSDVLVYGSIRNLPLNKGLPHLSGIWWRSSPAQDRRELSESQRRQLEDMVNGIVEPKLALLT